MAIATTHVTGEPGDVYYRYEVPTENVSAKRILLTRGDVAIIGVWTGALGQYFKAWAPMPKRDRAVEAELRAARQAVEPPA